MASTGFGEKIASNRLEWPRIASNGQPASTAASKLLSDLPANLAERLGSVQKT